MLKILICCGGGFSSSYVTERMKKEVIEKNLQDQVMVEFYPFAIIDEIKDNFDIIMCCPHLKIYVEQYLKTADIHIPIYLLPSKMYGLMRLEEIICDGQDIINLYQLNPANPVCFPGEENLLRIKRSLAYRHHYHITGKIIEPKLK